MTGAVSIFRFSLALLLAVFVTPVEATVFWDEDWENHAAPNWPIGTSDPRYPDGANPGICPGSPGLFCNPAQDVAFSGTHSLKRHYDGGVSGDASGIVTNGFTRSYPSTDDVWFRLRYRTIAFTYNSPGTKIFHAHNSLYYPDHWIMQILSDNREFSVIGQNYVTGGTFKANMAHIPIGDDQWYCVEHHAKMNTPGQPDGILEIWVDGVQTMGYYNVNMRPTTNGGPGQPSILATFNSTDLFVQKGIGEMYYDDFAVGDTRIGCGGGGDFTPPSITITSPASEPYTTNLSTIEVLIWLALSTLASVHTYLKLWNLRKTVRRDRDRILRPDRETTRQH